MHEKHSIKLRVSFSFSSHENEIEMNWTQFLDWNENERNESDYFQADSSSELSSEHI